MANRNDVFSKAGNRNDRFQQMSKQQQLIEEKKRLILNKLQDKKRIQNEETSKTNQDSGEQPAKIEVKPSTANIFTNDGSFFDQFQKFSEQSKTQMENVQQTRERLPSYQQTAPVGQPCWQDSSPIPMHPFPPPPLPHSIPSPLPLVPHSIPPPRPLDIPNIPPPHPLALHRIPPPPPPPCFQPLPFFNLAPPPPPPPPPVPQMPQSTLPMPVPADIDRSRPANPISYPLTKPADNLPDRTGSPTKEEEFKPANVEDLYEPDIDSDVRDDFKEVDEDSPSPSHELTDEKPPFFNIKEELDEKKYIKEEVKVGVLERIKAESSDLQQNLSNESYNYWNKEDYEAEVKLEAELKMEMQANIKEEKSSQQHELSEKAANRDRKRKSRWGEKAHDIPLPVIATPPVMTMPVVASTVPKISVTGMSGHLLTKVTRTEPGLLQYALQAYGSTNLTEEDWKKAEDNYKVHLLYQDLLNKRAEIQRLHEKGKFKYEYDSDEETEGGTWEHKCREKEMIATKMWAESLTEMAKGKHHIGDFLPPDELKRFMDKYSALKGGKEPDLSDYKEYKLTEENKGFQMLQKLGWTEGQGLGSDGGGIVEPINKAKIRDNNQGLGVNNPGDVDEDDDEYAAYRKRMMLAYRFRPNPLNNPRRPYY